MHFRPFQCFEQFLFLVENRPIRPPPLLVENYTIFFKPSRSYILNIKYIHYLSCQYEIWLYFQNKADIWNYCKFFLNTL